MKKIKLPLEMANGVQVRTLEELKENWNLEKILNNYLNGKLVIWLNDRYYTDLAEQVTALSDIHDNVTLQKEICKIFDVTFNDSVDINEINERNRRIALIRQYTDDESIWKNVEKVAFDQEELADLLDAGENIIYLCDNKFSIPLNICNKKYIGLGNVEIQVNSKEYVDFSKYGIELKNIHFNEEYVNLVTVTLYKKGEELKKEEKYKDALEFYKKAVGLGNRQAMNSIGNMYYSGNGVEKDYHKAMEWFKKAAELGDDYAFNYIGTMYCNGNGVEKDYHKAMEWYKKAVELGNEYAFSNIGNMYYYGYGVEKDYHKAMEWYRKGAELGDDYSCNSIGNMYYYGNGVEKDYHKAMEWYRKGAELGDDYSCNSIGNMYYSGNGVEKDYHKAMEWYRKGAKLGNKYAFGNIGNMYYNGNGVEKDYHKAMEWYKKGADLGDKYAKQQYDHYCSLISISGQVL